MRAHHNGVDLEMSRRNSITNLDPAKTVLGDSSIARETQKHMQHVYFLVRKDNRCPQEKISDVMSPESRLE